MAVTRTTSQLTILDVTLTSSGKVHLIFSIGKTGLWTRIPASCKAIPPGSTTGFPMTPDPSGTASDPIAATVAGGHFLFVWDAPRDGFRREHYIGWTFQLAYYDKYCEQDPEPEEPPPVPKPVPPPPPPPPPFPDPDPDPVLPPPPVPPPPPPPEPPVIVPVPPPVPVPPEDVPDDIENPVEPGGDADDLPTPGGDGGSSIPHDGTGKVTPPSGKPSGYPDEPWPGWPPEWPWPPNEYPAPPTWPEGWGWPPPPDAPWPPVAWWSGWPGPPGFYVDPGSGQVYDHLGTLVGPGTLPAEEVPVPFPYSDYEALRVAEQVPVGYDDGTEKSLDISEGDVREDQADGAEEILVPTPGLLETSPFPSTLYDAPTQLGALRLEGFCTDTSVLQTDYSRVFFTLKNDDPGAITNLIYGVEVKDGSGNRFIARHPVPIDQVNGESGYGASVSIPWDAIELGTATVLVFVATPDFQPLVSKTFAVDVWPADEAVDPAAPPGDEILSPAVVRAAGFQGAVLEAVFEGVADRVGAVDTFNLIARNHSALVVKTSWDAYESGFRPRLTVRDANGVLVAQVDTPLTRNGTPIQDHTHSVGYVTPVTAGAEYYCTVTHQGLAVDNRWRFWIFTEDTPIPITSNLTLSGTSLTGFLRTPYGRWLALENVRTGQRVTLQPQVRGQVADVANTLEGAPLTARQGDVILILRRGLDGSYERSRNTLQEVTV